MFAGVAKHYDFFNHLFTLGLDVWWRRKLVQSVKKHHCKCILDLATGSGDIASLLKKQRIDVFASDFCYPMLRQAQFKSVNDLICSDASFLPFKRNSFDGVTIGFGFRNFVNRDSCLKEIFRVLKTEGKIFILEFSQPHQIISFLYFWYLKNIMPFFTQILSKQGQAYQYLGKSIQEFPNQETLKNILEQHGFKNVFYSNLIFGIVAIHIGTKPNHSEL
jgi:demethylmenaquinone methyltransferase/2-methoxy-6-polyprenyl-1,4-benzoquinol methylase